MQKPLLCLAPFCIQIDTQEHIYVTDYGGTQNNIIQAYHLMFKSFWKCPNKHRKHACDTVIIGALKSSTEYIE